MSNQFSAISNQLSAVRRTIAIRDLPIRPIRPIRPIKFAGGAS